MRDSDYDLYRSIQSLDKSIVDLKIKKTEGKFCFNCDPSKSKQTDMLKLVSNLADRLSSFPMMGLEGKVKITLLPNKDACNKKQKDPFFKENNLEDYLSKTLNYKDLISDNKKGYSFFINLCLKW